MSDRELTGRRALIALLILAWSTLCPLLAGVFGYATAYWMLWGGVVGWLCVDCWRAEW